MSLITGGGWGWGLRFDAYGPVAATGAPVDDAMLGAIDAPGCIAAGSTVMDSCVSVPASTAIIRSNGKLTVCTNLKGGADK